MSSNSTLHSLTPVESVEQAIFYLSITAVLTIMMLCEVCHTFCTGTHLPAEMTPVGVTSVERTPVDTPPESPSETVLKRTQPPDETIIYI
jgi:hypothetical protein